MKYHKIPTVGTRMGLDKQDIDWMQSGMQEAINGLLKLLGDDNYILSGVEESGTQITDGWIYYNGQLLKFKGGPINTTFLVVDEEINEDTGDYEKYATPGGGIGEIQLSGLKRLDLSTKLLAKDSFLFNTDPGQGDEIFTIDIDNSVNLAIFEYNHPNTSLGNLAVNLPDPLNNDEIILKIRSTSPYHIPYEIFYDSQLIVSGNSNVSGDFYTVLHLKSIQGNWICTSISNSN